MLAGLTTSSGLPERVGPAVGHRRAASAGAGPAPIRPVDPSRNLADHLELSSSVRLSHVGTAVAAAVWSLDRGTVERQLAVTAGSVEEVWINGTGPDNAAMARLAREIAGAHEEIRIQNFRFDVDSPAARTVLDALAAKQRQDPAFRVYVIYTRSSSSLLGSGSVEGLAQAFEDRGIRARIARYTGLLPSRRVNHAKTFVIDGTTALAGGVNIENHHEKDVLIKLRGPVVGTLLADFSNAWRESKIYLATGDGVARLPDASGRELPAAPPARARQAGGPPVPMVFLSKDSGGRLIADPYRNNADQGLLAALRSARHLIRIQTPNLNDPAVVAALETAVRRGAILQILLPKGGNGFWANLGGMPNDQSAGDFFRRLPEEARHRFEVRWFSADGETIAKNHTKYVSIDGAWAYVGSQNLDGQSFRYSREAGIGIDDRRTVARLDAEIFAGDWTRGLRVDAAALAAELDAGAGDQE